MSGATQRGDADGSRLARGFARAVVALRWLIPLAWIAAPRPATTALPQLTSEGGGSLQDLVPADSQAASAAALAAEEFGAPLAADTIVVEHDPEGLSPETHQR